MEKMSYELQKERASRYGSFLFCPQKKTLCFGINTPDGLCHRKVCCLEDPEYIALQKRIDENRKKNEKIERIAREKARHEKPASIKKQTQTQREILAAQIKNKEEYARSAYRRGWTNTGDKIMQEIIALNAKLRKMDKEVRSDKRSNQENHR